MPLDAAMIEQVAGEVHESLQAAGSAIQESVSNPADMTPLRIAATHLHQAQGTLQMADCSAAALLLAEAEALIQMQLGEQPLAPESFSQTLLTALATADNCLGDARVAGCNDQALLKQINRLRRQQGKAEIAALEIFRPDLGLYPGKPNNADSNQADIGIWRDQYGSSLKLWLKHTNDSAPLKQMMAALDQLELAASSPSCGLLWASAAAVCESILLDGKATAEARQYLAQTEQWLKQAAESGAMTRSDQARESLIRGLLYQLVQSPATGGRGKALLQQLHLDADRPAETAEHAQLAWLQQIQPELESRVATARLFLDDYFDPARDDAETLRPLLALLDELRQLAAGGKDAACGLKDLLAALYQVCHGFVNGRLVSAETVVLHLAEGLLVLETSAPDAAADFSAWCDRVEQAGNNLRRLLQQGAKQREDAPAPSQTDADIQKLLTVVADEVRTNLHQVEQAVTGFAEDTARPEELAPAPAALREIRGVLDMLDKQATAGLARELGDAVAALETGQLQSSQLLLDAIALATGAIEASMTALASERPDVDALAISALKDLRHALSQASSAKPGARRHWIAQVGEILGQWLDQPADSDIRARLLTTLENADDQVFAGQRRQLMDAITQSSTESGALDPARARDVRQIFQSISRRAIENDEVAAETPADSGSADQAAPAALDPELEDMFVREAREHLQALFAAGQASSDAPAGFSLRRSIHALAGSSAALGISSMAEASSALEGLLDKLDSANGELDAEHREVLLEYAESVTRLLQALEKHAPWEPVNTRFRKLDERLADLDSGQARADETASYGIRDSVDLTDVYRDELKQLLQDFHATMTAWFSAREDQTLLAELIRIMHTIKGGARVTDLDSIAELAYATERLLQRVEHQNGRASRELRELLLRVEQVLQQAAENIGKELMAGDVTELVEQLDSARRSDNLSSGQLHKDAVEKSRQAPADSAESQQDDEIFAIFLDEATDILSDMDSVLTRLQRGNDADALKDLKRQFHTLKGGARMVGLTELGDLSHGVESMLQTNLDQGGVLDDRRLSLLREIRTEMIIAMESVRDGRAPALRAVSAKVEQLTGAARANTSEAPAQTATATATGRRKQKTARVRKKSRPDSSVLTNRQVGKSPTLPEHQADVPARSSAIRVDIHTLDNLVNLTNEIGVSRSRLRLQYSGFVSMLEEMRSVAERFQTYFRDFEIEAETAMTSSPMLDTQASAAEFDPLELDRFSRLQQLTRSLSECVDDLTNIESGMERLVWQSETLFSHDARIYGKLHEGLLKTRMQPVGVLAGRLQHLVRMISKETGKKAELVISGKDVELDRTILERMVAPLEHMVRNALVHGIEKPKKRRKLGKPEKGMIRIEFAQVYNEVVMQFSDDGAGIDMEKLRQRAVATGLAQESIEDRELAQLVLESGVSTSDQVTQLSGRGVGMEIVASEIRYLGGHIDVETRAGKGVTYIINIPLSLSITRANLVRVAGQVLAIPLSSVVQVQTLSENEFSRLKAAQKPGISYRGKKYHYSSLAARLGFAAPDVVDGEQNILLVRSGRRCIALGVDEVLDVEECVIKPLNPQISAVRSVTGATILGNGEVALLLDPGNLRREHRIEGAPWKTGRRSGESAPPRARLLIVDDSVTVRKVTERLLKRHGYRVDLARDGEDALKALDERKPDLILIDIEMPKMDGYELMEKIRQKPGMADIPTVVVTSRSGGKHRNKALALGAADYFAKPYDDAALINSIDTILKKARTHE